MLIPFFIAGEETPDPLEEAFFDHEEIAAILPANAGGRRGAKLILKNGVEVVVKQSTRRVASDIRRASMAMFVQAEALSDIT